MNWQKIDEWVHTYRFLPGFVVSFVCYKYDRSLGATRAQAKIGWLY